MVNPFSVHRRYKLDKNAYAFCALFSIEHGPSGRA